MVGRVFRELRPEEKKKEKKKNLNTILILQGLVF